MRHGARSGGIAVALWACLAGPAAAQQPPSVLDPGEPPPHAAIIPFFLKQAGLAPQGAPALYRGLDQVGPVQPEGAERSGCTDYSLQPEEVAVGEAGATQVIVKIRSSGTTAPWQLAASVPWITVASAAGRGEGEAKLNLAANPQPLPREGEVTLGCGGETVRTVPVRQAAAQ